MNSLSVMKGGSVNHRIAFVLAAAVVFLTVAGTASAETPFEGRKKCSSCHKSEAD